jgi:hypothetical protein
VDAPRYLDGLWQACVSLAARRADGSSCELLQETVASLHALERRHTGAASITVATGAAAAAIEGVPSRVAELLDLSQVCTYERFSFMFAVHSVPSGDTQVKVFQTSATLG